MKKNRKPLTRKHRKRLARLNEAKRTEKRGLRLKLKRSMPEMRQFAHPTESVTLEAGEYQARRVSNPLGENKPDWIVTENKDGQTVGLVEKYLRSGIVAESYGVELVETEEIEEATHEEETIPTT